MTKPAQAEPELAPTKKRYNGKLYTLKENGLPQGYALFWKTVNGKEYVYTKFAGKSVSCKTTDWKAAVDFVEALRTKSERQSARGPIEDVLIDELLNDYIKYLEGERVLKGAYEQHKNSSTAYNTAKQIDKHVRPFFGPLMARSLSTEVLQEYRTERTNECVKEENAKWLAPIPPNRKRKEAVDFQNTLDHMESHLRAALNHAAKSTPPKISKDWIPEFTAKNEKECNRNNTISDEESDNILNHLPDYMKPIYLFCQVTGVRKKEARFVHRSEIDYLTWHITLRKGETKATKSRTVGIPKQHQALFVEWEERTRREYPSAEYFFHLNGEQLTDFQVTQAFIDTCVLLGYSKLLPMKNGKQPYEHKIHWHDTRRTFATKLSKMMENQLPRNAVLDTIGMSDPILRLYDKNKATEMVVAALEADYANKTSAPVPVAPVVTDKKTRLIELKDLFEEGLITDEEYKEGKMKVLAY